jgi:ketosteroid isomerase-like protein
MEHHQATMLFEAMNARDIARLEALLDGDAAFDFPGTGLIQGRRRILVFFKVLFRKFESLVFDVHEVVIDGDRACVVWENSGRHATGEPYANRGMTLIRLTGDRIAFISDYFKDTSFTGAPG